MAEYIDKNATVGILEAMSRSADCECIKKRLEKAAKRVSAIPAADVAPVVHGRWEWLGPNRLVTDCMCGTCSACKVRSKYIVNTMLCPNCGAKMDGKDGDDAGR